MQKSNTKKCTICKKTKHRDDFYVARIYKEKPILCSRCKKCELVYQKDRYSVKDIRFRIISRLGKHCVKCGFDDIRALQIDHIDGGGSKEIKSFSGNYRNYYKSIEQTDLKRFQILCANCNWIKRYENEECKNDKL